jgi:hypothetical protein
MATPAARALDSSGPPPGAPPPGATTPPAPPGSGPSAPFFSTWDKPEQKEVRDWVANKNYADPFVLAKTARDLEREAATIRAGKGYPVDTVDPKTNQPVRDENAWKAWNALTGVPETPDKYEIPIAEGNPYPNFKTYMAEELHKIGVPAAMAPKLSAGYERALQRLETENRQQEDSASELALRELETTWGPQYKERMAMAARGKEWISKEAGGLTELQMRVFESMLGTSKFLTAMWKLGAGNGEARFHGNDGGDQGGRGFEGGASQAQVRVAQIMADRSAGKITDQQWRETYEKETVELGKIISAGFAPPPG